jgi:GGDEF domain-containing protein
MNISPQSLHEVVEALPDPAFILTESGLYAAIFGGIDTQFYHDGKHLIGKYLHDVLPPQQAETFLAQIRTCLKQRCMISFEYGLAGADVTGLNEKRDSSEDAVILRADKAMYRAKNSGRNRVEVYTTTLNQQD